MAHELWGCTWKQLMYMYMSCFQFPMYMYMGNCGNRFGACGVSVRAIAVDALLMSVRVCCAWVHAPTGT